MTAYAEMARSYPRRPRAISSIVTLEQNASEVDDVATGRKDDAFLTSSFEYRTGREAYTAGQLEPYLRTTYGVGIFLLHDPGSPRGYRIHTAYPRNDGD